MRDADCSGGILRCQAGRSGKEKEVSVFWMGGRSRISSLLSGECVGRAFGCPLDNDVIPNLEWIRHEPNYPPTGKASI